MTLSASESTDLAVKLSQRGRESFEFAVSTGLLGRLLEELGSAEDVLVQMNCVELLLPLMGGGGGIQVPGVTASGGDHVRSAAVSSEGPSRSCPHT